VPAPNTFRNASAMDLGPLLDAAVDQMAKDPDWLLNFVLTTMFRVESIPESRMKPLKERYLSQQRQIHAEPPSSPLQTTVDDSHKSDDGMPTLSDHVRHVDDGFEDLAVPSPLEEDVGLACSHLQRNDLITYC
jgi:hypothetical protein